jgi:hypothetical protein
VNTPTPQIAPSNEIWAVLDQEELPRIAGFLIADQSRYPNLIAYIGGSADVEILTAKRIAEGRRSPETAMDLRGRPIPDFILNKPLVSLGVAGANPIGVCGAFTRHGATIAFSVMVRPGTASEAQPVSEKLHAADDQSKKEGTR